ncbi:hypothetical protein D3C78_1213930 [compost metagenome]
MPVNAAVLCSTAAKNSGLAVILFDLWEMAGFDHRQNIFQQIRRRLSQFMMECKRRFFRGNSDTMLRHNGTGVGTAHHFV